VENLYDRGRGELFLIVNQAERQSLIRFLAFKQTKGLPLFRQDKIDLPLFLISKVNESRLLPRPDTLNSGLFTTVTGFYILTLKLAPYTPQSSTGKGRLSETSKSISN
jgi:hypothetical protein